MSHNSTSRRLLSSVLFMLSLQLQHCASGDAARCVTPGTMLLEFALLHNSLWVFFLVQCHCITHDWEFRCQNIFNQCLLTQTERVAGCHGWQRHTSQIDTVILYGISEINDVVQPLITGLCQMSTCRVYEGRFYLWQNSVICICSKLYCFHINSYYATCCVVYPSATRVTYLCLSVYTLDASFLSL